MVNFARVFYLFHVEQFFFISGICTMIKAARHTTPRKQAYNRQVVTAYFTQMGLPTPVYEHQHIEGRKYALDISFPAHRLGIEIEGGVWTDRSGHRTALGVIRDMRKHNLGLMAGWRVLRLLPKELMTLTTVNCLKTLLNYPQSSQK